MVSATVEDVSSIRHHLVLNRVVKPVEIGIVSLACRMKF